MVFFAPVSPRACRLASLWIYVRVKGLDRETDKIVLLLYLFQRILQRLKKERRSHSDSVRAIDSVAQTTRRGRSLLRNLYRIEIN